MISKRWSQRRFIFLMFLLVCSLPLLVYAKPPVKGWGRAGKSFFRKHRPSKRVLKQKFARYANKNRSHGDNRERIPKAIKVRILGITSVKRDHLGGVSRVIADVVWEEKSVRKNRHFPRDQGAAKLVVKPKTSALSVLSIQRGIGGLLLTPMFRSIIIDGPKKRRSISKRSTP